MSDQPQHFRTPSALEAEQLRQLLDLTWRFLADSREGLPPEGDPLHLTVFVTGAELIAVHIPILTDDRQRYIDTVRVAASQLEPTPDAIVSTSAAYLTTLKPAAGARAEVLMYRLETRDGCGGTLMAPVVRRPGQPPEFGTPDIVIYDHRNTDAGTLCGYFRFRPRAQRAH